MVGVQETRIDSASLPPRLRRPAGYHAAWGFACRPGYSGVATFSQRAPLADRDRHRGPAFDAEGRVVETEFERFILYNVYFPKGSGPLRDNSRVPVQARLLRRLLRPLRSPAAPPRASRSWCSATSTPRTRPSISRTAARTRRRAASCPRSARRSTLHLTPGFVDTYRRIVPERGAVHLVEPAARRARAQRRLAHRLRVGEQGALATRDAARSSRTTYVAAITAPWGSS